uniref:Ion_trans domain-containing protein n=1 Tax=Macrostomum lignano TaxID=282301 RepID=A0A1I8GQ15_9PLAT
MGMIFFFIYMLFVSFILVNFFLTIILISFKHVKDSWTEETNQYEIVEYVAGKFKKLFGIGKAGDAQSRIDSRFAYIADELDIEEQEREIQLKVDSMMDRLLLVMTGEPPDKDHIKQQLQRSGESGGDANGGRAGGRGGRQLVLSGDA